MWENNTKHICTKIFPWIPKSDYQFDFSLYSFQCYNTCYTCEACNTMEQKPSNPKPWTKNLVFQGIHTFPFVKVHVYVYTTCIQWTCVYTRLGQGEPTYTTFSSLYVVWYVILCCLPAILWSLIWMSCLLKYFLEAAMHFIISINTTTMNSITSDISFVVSSS